MLDQERLLSVENLEVSYGENPVLKHVSFTLDRGERLAVVGESGSGKSTTIAAILGLLPTAGRITMGSIKYQDVDLTEASESQYRTLRGRSIALIPQDPMSNLNPTMRVGDQIADALKTYGLKGRSVISARVEELMAEAGIKDAARRRRQYPHEFSGGMRQRVLIAMALAGEPDLIIADEPTSALDVTVQKQILDHLEKLVAQRNMALLFVTHDLGVAADRTDTILVMSAGEVVERGAPKKVLGEPEHEYTQRLVAAAPVLPALLGPVLTNPALLGPAQPGSGLTESVVEHDPQESTSPAGDGSETESVAHALEVKDLRKEFRLRGSRQSVTALDGVSFYVPQGTTTALIGESGSGKSTLAQITLGLQQPTSGEVILSGSSMLSATREGRRALRRRTQPVFQDPYTSLNPYWSIESVVTEPLALFSIGTKAERRAKVRQMVDQVALPESVLQRHPGELSGGQRQRVAIARALISEPELLICDEAVSALDVLVQAQVLELLSSLQEEMNVSCLFITHDLSVTADFSDDTVVLKQGQIVEAGPTQQVISSPRAEYTRQLVEAVPGRELAVV